MQAFQRGRPDEAAALFARVHRLAGRRAEICWSARLHEALSLRRVGREASAREALAEVASGRRPDLPQVPPPLAEAARALLAAGRG